MVVATLQTGETLRVGRDQLDWSRNRQELLPPLSGAAFMEETIIMPNSALTGTGCLWCTPDKVGPQLQIERGIAKGKA